MTVIKGSRVQRGGKSSYLRRYLRPFSPAARYFTSCSLAFFYAGTREGGGLLGRKVEIGQPGENRSLSQRPPLLCAFYSSVSGQTIVKCGSEGRGDEVTTLGFFDSFKLITIDREQTRDREAKARERKIPISLTLLSKNNDLYSNVALNQK